MKRTESGNFQCDAKMAHILGLSKVFLIRSLLPETFGRFAVRTALSHLEDLQWALAAQLSVLEAKRAFARVPAYRQHAGKLTKKFSELPLTTKGNYIKPYLQQKEQIFLDGKIPHGCITTSSTGTTGEPVIWYTSDHEASHNNSVLRNRVRAVLGSQPIVAINGFALGLWATGMTVKDAIGAAKNATLFNTGPDTTRIVKIMAESQRNFPGTPIVVTGYPPHMEEVVKKAAEMGISFKAQKTIAVVGGEPMSEALRDRISGENGFDTVISCFGASDLDVNLAVETEYATALRRKMASNPEIGAKLLPGRPGHTPMVFQFDPLQHMIEVIDGRLVVTINTRNRLSPRIRYDIGDVGDVLRFSEVERVLNEMNIDLGVKPMCRLPMVFVWGRIDDMVIFNGANLGWAHLQQALNSTGLEEMVQQYGVLQTEEPVSTDLLIQATNAKTHQYICENGPSILQMLLDELCLINEDFAFQMNVPGVVPPRLRLFKERSPMSDHAEKTQRHRKVQRIFLGDKVDAALKVEDGGTLISL